MEKLFLGIDQGSSSTKALLFSGNGEIVWKSRVPVSLKRYEDGRAEQDPEEILSSVRCLLKDAQTVIKSSNTLAGIGLSVQRSGVCAWEKNTGAVLHPVITWQDQRETSLPEERSPMTGPVYERAALPLNAHYAAPPPLRYHPPSGTPPLRYHHLFFMGVFVRDS